MEEGNLEEDGRGERREEGKENQMGARKEM